MMCPPSVMAVRGTTLFVLTVSFEHIVNTMYLTEYTPGLRH